ncbi:hypothetical protein GQ600_5652 [Phytophthora cactorum]|nr:hypothetical protein GQ600_5652 [Phytophthora cactorum]
MLFGYFYL